VENDDRCKYAKFFNRPGIASFRLMLFTRVVDLTNWALRAKQDR
jgi:hypothetical protein